MRAISPEAILLIKEFESFRPIAYKDLGGVWTIGYGSTDNVKDGDTITEEQATQRMLDKIEKEAQVIDSLVKVKLNDNQFAALICFVYNVGLGNFSNSTLLKKLNKGWYEQVGPELLKWCHVNGEEVGGLKRRRAAEAALFNKR
jgi:lysozyme